MEAVGTDCVEDCGWRQWVEAVGAELLDAGCGVQTVGADCVAGCGVQAVGADCVADCGCRVWVQTVVCRRWGRNVWQTVGGGSVADCGRRRWGQTVGADSGGRLCGRLWVEAVWKTVGADYGRRRWGQTVVCRLWGADGGCRLWVIIFHLS